MFTAFTAFELYRMISTRKRGSRDKYVHCRYVSYVTTTVVCTGVIVAILSVMGAFGGLTTSNRHTLCYIGINATTSGADSAWMGYLAISPSAISWIACCILSYLLFTNFVCSAEIYHLVQISTGRC